MNEQNKNYGYYNQNFDPYTGERLTPQQEPKKEGSGLGKKIVALALCCSLIGSAAGAGGMFVGMRALNKNSSQPAQSTQASQTVQAETTDSNNDSKNSTQIVNGTHEKSNSGASVKQTTVDSGKRMTASELYNKYVNSTVGIKTSVTTNYFGYTTQGAASGSGFIISKDGYIVTNYHVIEDADSVKVSCYDGTEYDAEIVGTDKSNDLAVLKIEASGLTPVVLGSSDDLKIGDDVVAIGNPLGELTFSLTSGVISALDRTITTEKATMNLIQTDCSINSGNSGGALFNMYGEVVGITNAKYSSNGSGEASIDNIAFAIPIDSVRQIINSLIENGYVMKPFIGVSLKDVTADSQQAGIPKGAQVEIVNDDSPAAEAGLQVGDVITGFDGKAIEGSSDLVAAVKKQKAGDVVKLSVYRKGAKIELQVKISEKKQDDTEEKKSEKQQQEQQQQQQYENYGNYGGYDDYDFPFGGMFGY